MTIKLTHIKKAPKAKKYKTPGGTTITLGTNNPEIIRLWNAERFVEAFDLFTKDEFERRNIRQMPGRMGRTNADNNRNGRTRRTTPRFV